jgi:TRAP-type uncharacterized transport system substrate-binding protein
MLGHVFKFYPAVLAGCLAVTPILSALAQDRAPVSRYEGQRQISNTNTITIMASQAVSAYTRVAEDMQSVLDDTKGNTMRVLPILGRGGGQNFIDILFLQGIDLGIVERDVIDTFKAKDPQLYGDIERRLRYVLKLSNSEMHVFARHEIKKLEDLRGKKVSFFKPLSSSDQALTKIMDTCGIQAERLYMDQDAAAEKLKQGEIVAAGRISGAPHDAFTTFTNEHGHFLPLDKENLPAGCFDKLMKFYLPAFQKHDHYPAIIAEGDFAPTVANATILATYNFPEQTERYQSLAKFTQKLFDNIDKFRDGPRHPKWKEVNIAAEVPGWIRFKPAQEWIDANTKSTSDSGAEPSEELKLAFERYLKEKLQTTGSQNLTSAQKQALLDEFAKWWQSRNSSRR